MGLAEVVHHDVKCGEEGVQIDHWPVPFPSGSGSKPTLNRGHLPLKFSTDNSHQAFNTGANILLGARSSKNPRAAIRLSGHTQRSAVPVSEASGGAASRKRLVRSAPALLYWARDGGGGEYVSPGEREKRFGERTRGR